MNASVDIEGMHQVALTCKNLDRSADFYADALGLQPVARFDPPGLAFFDVHGVRLSIQQSSEVESVSSVIYFRVADIDAAVEALRENGVHMERDPALVFRDEEGQFGAAGEEEWMAFFRDPDGNLLALVSRKQH